MTYFIKIFLLFFFSAAILLEAQEATAVKEEKQETFLFSKRKFAIRHHWYWGAGAVVSDVPVMKSRFTVPFAQLLYEYNVSDPSKTFRFSMGGGLYGLNVILPVPVFQPSLYIGSENNDLMARFSAGPFYDVIIGGHAGVLFSGGVVFKNRIDVSFVIVPFGSQPVRPYPEIIGKSEEVFLDTARVGYRKDPNGKSLVIYDGKHYHPDDDRYNNNDDEYYYSQYDIDYGNGEYGGHSKSNPGDFDYIDGREYITFPYFGLMITFRH